MTLLSVINNVQDRLGLTRTSSIVMGTDDLTRQLLALANKEGKCSTVDYQWPELEREHTFTLATDTANYTLPADFDRHINETQWDRNSHWMIIGPLTPQEWQWRKSGIVQSTPFRRWRVKGRQDSRLYLDPTPSSSDSGLTMVLEYVSGAWVQPKTWAATTAFAAGAYTTYNGNNYVTTAGGTTGATAPTHTSGSVSDGGVTWTFTNAKLDSFTADTDTSIIPELCIESGIEWRFLQAKGMPSWVFAKQEYDDLCSKWVSKTRGSPDIDLTGGAQSPFLITPWQLPDSGYGV